MTRAKTAEHNGGHVSCRPADAVIGLVTANQVSTLTWRETSDILTYVSLLLSIVLTKRGRSRSWGQGMYVFVRTRVVIVVLDSLRVYRRSETTEHDAPSRVGFDSALGIFGEVCLTELVAHCCAVLCLHGVFLFILQTKCQRHLKDLMQGTVTLRFSDIS